MWFGRYGGTGGTGGAFGLLERSLCLRCLPLGLLASALRLLVPSAGLGGRRSPTLRSSAPRRARALLRPVR